MNQTIKGSRIEEIARPAWALGASLGVPIKDEEVVFNFPAFGPDNYNGVVRKVLDNRQRLPTGKQTAFMLDEAYNSTNPEVKNSPRTKFVRDTIMRDGRLWIPNVNVWTPNSIRNPGMYVVFDENGQSLAKVYTIEELEDRLSGGSTERGVRFSRDGTVSFAPRNTIGSGNHEKGTLAYDGAFIASCGIDGAEKLDNAANGFALEPYSWIVDNNSGNNIQSLSGLCRGGNLVGRLVADFSSGGDLRLGYVVSVSGSSDSAEGTAPKN